MKNFFTAFLNSLYNPEWLKKQRFASGKAWSYFMLFVFALSVVVTVPIAVGVYPVAKTAENNFSSAVPDFEAVFKNGSLTVNRLAQPFVYKINNNDFVMVVDTISTSTVAISNYVSSTPVVSLLITSDRAEVVDSENGQSRIQKWVNLPDSMVTKQNIQSVLQNILQPWIYFLGIMALFVGFFIAFFITKLYTIMVVTLVVSITARLTGRDLKLKNLFVIGLYAITLPSIIGIIFTLVGVGIGYIQFMAMLAFMLAVVLTEKKKIIED